MHPLIPMTSLVLSATPMASAGEYVDSYGGDAGSDNIEDYCNLVQFEADYDLTVGRIEGNFLRRETDPDIWFAVWEFDGVDTWNMLDSEKTSLPYSGWNLGSRVLGVPISAGTKFAVGFFSWYDVDVAEERNAPVHNPEWGTLIGSSHGPNNGSCSTYSRTTSANRVDWWLTVKVTVDDDDNDGVDKITDCDDTNDSINPGAADPWYDGLDSNCEAANDFDALERLRRLAFADRVPEPEQLKLWTEDEVESAG